jgi:pyruvate/2-oxoglutarate dehydrogenase complex dihydrolipoamide dehydrogenase (E3) component
MARRGVRDVVVVEREAEAGGMPRFCPHPTFGLAEFRRLLSGPAYAAKLRATVDPHAIRTATTVTRIGADLETTISSASGEAILKPKRILLATGIRETPRAARLVSGERPRNIFTTGALQRIVAEGHALPFRRPVIVGTELVSFSALLSLREGGTAPVAMIEEASRVTARRPADLFARWAMRTPILFETAVVRINAADDDAARLVSVTLARPDGSQRTLECDAVVFTGRFTPEASLLGAHADLMDAGSRGPAIDQRWRAAWPGLYAAGNLLRPVETAGWCALEGRAAAASMAADIANPRSGEGRRVVIAVKGEVAFTTPSRIAVEDAASGRFRLGLRMTRAARGRFVFSADGNDVWRSARMSVLPERRILLSPVLPKLVEIGELQLRFETGER